ncbi:MAG: tRNA (adenosine(37)-N6)-threonylcarbamoyltransferase complex ATPase subunit type 1 TsaE [Gammaproteobacteria bacterium]|jgi:tRNA threonylcarbamoyladenosine biosynthesis protein TsaE
MRLHLPDETAQLELGAALARYCPAGALVTLRGDLGAGKTTLVRGFLREYGYRGAVKSPTYTLVEPYEFSGIAVYHFDLYRLSSPLELEEMGLRDYFDSNAICLVEWPERAGKALPEADVQVVLRYLAPGREAQLSFAGTGGEAVAAALLTEKVLKEYLLSD